MSEWSDVPYGDKIKELFEYRGIPQFIQQGGIEDPRFEYHLYKLQASIYELDNYLETVWELEEAKIESYWSDMKKELLYLVPDQSKHDQYLYQISVYLKREVGLRQKSFPLSTTLDYFYYYKSCDVRLMRRLIYDHSLTNRSKLQPRLWLLYDLATEINDDVDDLLEDLEAYNCNRLLLDLYVNGAAYAASTFKSFLLDLKRRNDLYVGPKGIKEDTYSAIEDTLSLLQTNLPKLKGVNELKTICFNKTNCFIFGV